jgi:hypothetical protein
MERAAPRGSGGFDHVLRAARARRGPTRFSHMKRRGKTNLANVGKVARQESAGELVLRLVLPYVQGTVALLVNGSLLQEARQLQLPIQLDAASVSLGSLEYCLEMGLERRLLCQFAIRNRDLALLQHARQRGCPWGELLRGVGPRWRGAAPLIEWALAQGWRPKPKAVVKLVMRSSARGSRDEVLAVLSLFDRFPDAEFCERLPKKIYQECAPFNEWGEWTDDTEDCPFSCHVTSALGERIRSERPGALEWLLAATPQSERSLRGDPFLLTLLVMTQQLAVPLWQACVWSDDGGLWDGAAVLCIDVAAATRRWELLDAVVQRYEHKAEKLRALFFKTLANAPCIEALARLWAAAGEPPLADDCWQQLADDDWEPASLLTLDSIVWLHERGAAWAEPLLWCLVKRDRADLLVAVAARGCPIFAPHDNRGRHVHRSPAVLQLCLADARWACWLPYLSLSAAVRLGSAEALQRLLALGARLESSDVRLGAASAAGTASNIAALRLMQNSCDDKVLRALVDFVGTARSPNAAELQVLLEHPRTRAALEQELWRLKELRQRTTHLRRLFKRRRGRQLGLLLMQANVLHYGSMVDLFPVAWIGGRFERLVVCVETHHLHLSYEIVFQFAKRGWLRLLQALMAFCFSLGGAPLCKAWFGMQGVYGSEELWVGSIRAAAYDCGDDEMLRWICEYADE